MSAYLGYGLSVSPALGGALAGMDLVPISEVARNPLRVEHRPSAAGGPPTQFSVWFEPDGSGKTPMCAAMQRAHQIFSLLWMFRGSGGVAVHANTFWYFEEGDKKPSARKKQALSLQNESQRV